MTPKSYLLFLLSIFVSCSSGNSKEQERKDSMHVDSLANTQREQDNPNQQEGDKLLFHSAKEKEIYDQYSGIISTKVLYIDELNANLNFAHASGFLIKKRGKIYLVTNYHVVTEHVSNDTLLFNNQFNLVPTQLHIFFYRKQTTAPPYSLTYDLYTNNKQNFISIVNNNKHTQISYGTRQVFDIAFLPINIKSLPKDILIDTIGTGGDSPTSVINDGDMISIWGFPGPHREIKRPSIDTATLIIKKRIPGSDLQINIHYSAHKDLEGHSGGPIYLHLKDGIHFFGMDCDQLADSRNRSLPLKALSDGTTNQITCYFLSSPAIDYLIETNLH
jgi:hypothetical protein